MHRLDVARKKRMATWVGAMEPPSRLHIRMAMLMIVAGWSILDETEGCRHPTGFGVIALDMPSGGVTW